MTNNKQIPNSKSQIPNKFQITNSKFQINSPEVSGQAKQIQNSKFQMPNAKNKYDLEERTSKLGEDVIDFCKEISSSLINKPLISQLVRSATSIGANYMEADAAESRKDFRHKIGICKKEAKETIHWLRMIAKAEPSKKDECGHLAKEAHELLLIFSSIINKSKTKVD